MSTRSRRTASGSSRADGRRTPAAAPETRGTVDPTPLWAKVLWVIGLAVSVYLTWDHYNASSTLVCPEGEFLNCESVTTSPWSYLFGVPVALLGLVYMVEGVLFAFVQWRRLTPEQGRRSALLLTGVGLLFVLYLVWAELVMIGQVCTWCTVVHVIVAVLFLYYLANWYALRD